jgi:hypothetical protein
MLEHTFQTHFLLLGVLALCYLRSNDCHIPWEGGAKPLWVFEVSYCHITFAIGVEFHCVTLKVESNYIIIY